MTLIALCHRECSAAIYVPTLRFSVIASAARQTITEPRPHCHRERSVAIYVPTLRFSVIASEAWQSIAHTHVNVRVWTTTSAVSLLAVTENKGLFSSAAQPGKPLQNQDLTVIASAARRSMYRPSVPPSSRAKRGDPLLILTTPEENGLPRRLLASSQ